MTTTAIESTSWIKSTAYAHPMPYSASERAQGLGRYDRIPYLADDVTEGEYRPLPALREDVQPVIRIPNAPTPTFTVERQSVQHPQTVENGFVVPALQALGTAICVSLACGLLAWGWGWSWRVPVIMGGLTLAGAWFWRLGWADKLLWSLETLTRHVIDGNGTVGNPAFAVVNPATARATVAQESKQTAEDAKRQRLLAFVDRCALSGTSESAHGIQASGPDRDNYTACRDTLMSLGLAAWKNPGRPRGGWALATDPVTARSVVEKHVL